MKLTLFRSPFKKLSVILGASVVAGLIVELTLRVISPQYYPVIPAAYEYDPDTAFRLRPDAHLSISASAN